MMFVLLFRHDALLRQNCPLFTKKHAPHPILMPITCKGERSAAFFLLEQNRDNPVLEIYVVLTSRQWRDYMQNTAGEKAAACNRIIAAADRCEVCPAAMCRREPKRSGNTVIRAVPAICGLYRRQTGCRSIIRAVRPAGFRQV